MFTVEEITLMSYYRAFNRLELLEDLQEAHTVADDPEMITLIEEVIGKLQGITEYQYQQIDFALAVAE